MSGTHASQAQQLLSSIENLQRLERELQGELSSQFSQSIPSCVSATVNVGSSDTNTKTIPLSVGDWITVSNIPVNYQDPGWNNTFTVSINKDTTPQQLSVTRTDPHTGDGWGQNLVLRGTKCSMAGGGSSADSVGASNQELMDQINELGSARVSLFHSLDSIYNETAAVQTHADENVRQQRENVKIIENELKEARGRLAKLRQEKYNKVRAVEINAYDADRFSAYGDLVKIALYVVVPVVILLVISQRELIPDNAYISRENTNDVMLILGGLIVVVGLYYFLIKVYDISVRSNMNFQEYEWPFDPKTDGSSAGVSVLQRDADELRGDFGAMKKRVGSELSYADVRPGMIGCVGQECCAQGTVYNKSIGKCELKGVAAGATPKPSTVAGKHSAGLV